MQRNIVFLVSLLGLPLLAFPQTPIKLIAETNHSTIQFSVPISDGITRITGKFNEFSISLDMVEGDILKSTFRAVIQVNSINTGMPARDEDLKSEDFFESTKYPEITFSSDRIEKTETGYIATGSFQMHGITRTLSLPFMITEKRTETVIGFRSRTTIKRSDFGVGSNFKHTTDDNFIGDTIGVEIDFWTKKSKANP